MDFMIEFMKGRNMPISIKNDETEALARKVAELTGESLTEAIRMSLAERYDRLQRARAGRSLGDELNEIAQRCAGRPNVSTLSDDEILGYDELGIPTR
jgi:antitoxin VapB